jgi:hypothetical protein
MVRFFSIRPGHEADIGRIALAHLHSHAERDAEVEPNHGRDKVSCGEPSQNSVGIR